MIGEYIEKVNGWRILILVFVTLFYPYNTNAQNRSYQDFKVIRLTGLSSVECFVQDPLGMMWMGTSRGVFSYDGYLLRRVAPPSGFARSTENVHCGIVLNEEQIWFGSGSGLFVYNYKTDTYEMPPVDIPFDIRSLVLEENTLWIGSIQGLFKYHIATRKLEKITDPGIPHQSVYSMVRLEKGISYIGTYDGFCKYTPAINTFEKIELPHIPGKNNLCINSLLHDSVRGCIWIGSGGALFRYDLVSQSPERISAMDGSTIKSMTLDLNQNLLLGTDNGLYVYNPDQRLFYHTVHDPRDPQSLVNNVICGLFVDKEENVWLGSNGGISFYDSKQPYLFIPIPRLTGMGEGNSILKVYKDSYQNLWLGGTDGLIRASDRFNSTSSTSIWYRVGDKRFPLLHNYVRDIYEDHDRNLWIATDGGVGRFDYETEQFVRYTLVDSTRQFNSNWAHSLLEDGHGRLWVSTWQGGIFVTEKAELMKATKGEYTALRHFSSKDGFPMNHVLKIIQDRHGHIWAVCKGLFKIDPETGTLEKVPLYDENRKELIPLFRHVLCDEEGYIWAAVHNGVCRINPGNKEVIYTKFKNFEGEDIYSILEEGNRIWFSSSKGMIAMEKNSFEVNYILLDHKDLLGGFFDQSAGKLIFGMVDGICIFSKDLATIGASDSPLYLTGFFVNGKSFRPSAESIRYIRSFELDYDQDNVTFEFSDLLYSSRTKVLACRMEGLDSDWQIVEQGTNRVSYAHLSPGIYKLSVCTLGRDGNPSEVQSEFVLTIQPPWYYSGWAQFFYFILLVVLVLWVVNSIKVRNRLKIERINKEKSMELSRLKIDFFTDISHEFKTPLSLIIAPVSKLILEVKRPQLKKELKMIEQNALRLSTLINHALTFQRVDEREQKLIRSTVEIVAFSRKLFHSYETLFKAKEIEARFVSDRATLYAAVDFLKMESVLNNLISNACKFTRPGGSVELSLQYDEEARQLEIRVSDSGSGIPQDEIPYVFDRFFQSKVTSKKEGTGVGLYLVKSYVELHEGTVNVQSVEGEGTVFTVHLPLVPEEYLEPVEAPAETEVKEVNMEEAPLILVVDDNPQIVEFIASYLKTHYRVATAYDGRSGLELCLKVKPDLIIADVMMPDMDGLEMCRQIRKQASFAVTPIVMLTAKDDKKTEHASVKIGVECFIAKPFDLEFLLSRIKQLTGKQKQLEEKIRIEALAKPLQTQAISINEQFLANITKIIESKVADPDFNVNALVLLSEVDTKQLYRKIKQLTGKSPVDYIRSIRMKKAAMLLSQKKFSVAEVMYLVGFSNHSYFSKCFQKEFGKTPKQFMEEDSFSSTWDDTVS